MGGFVGVQSAGILVLSLVILWGGCLEVCTLDFFPINLGYIDFAISVTSVIVYIIAQDRKLAVGEAWQQGTFQLQV